MDIPRRGWTVPRELGRTSLEFMRSHRRSKGREIAIALSLEAIARRLEAIASRLEAIPSRVEAPNSFEMAAFRIHTHVDLLGIQVLDLP